MTQGPFYNEPKETITTPIAIILHLDVDAYNEWSDGDPIGIEAGAIERSIAKHVEKYLRGTGVTLVSSEWTED